ncbi:MAG TPA: pyridoxamine 5'-phosphate oxidase family protein, partial [Nitrospirota bacterium]|nr:pyridoxamine 5'-phosphate oxidase family protein [Nitrospirota bacterium]
PPAVRLIGTAGERRKATDAEIRAFRRRVAPYRMFRGHDMLWKDLKHVRDITFDSFEPVHVGALTIDLWKRGNES